MNRNFTRNRVAQIVVALIGAFALKFYYSGASADQLRWILAPTAALVEFFSGESFEFESRAGYFSRENGFLIANVCAGVNFLITAFLTLSMRKLLSDRKNGPAWSFLPIAAATAYLATLVANTVRISIALRLRRVSTGFDWASPEQLHRLEGVLVYFGFLLVLFIAGEKMESEKKPTLSQGLFFPLLVYYAMTLGVPLMNQAYRREGNFWAHSFIVLILPLLLILPFAVLRLFATKREEKAALVGS
jgi:exosortase K